MARNVYTTVLALVPTTAGPGTFLFTVPSGFVWDVRDVIASNPEPATGINGSLFGWYLITAIGSIPLFAMQPAISSFPYHFTLRQLLGTGDGLTFGCSEAGWSLRVTGYELTLP